MPLPKFLDSRGDETTSQVLTPFVLQQLAVAVPSRFAFADWRLLYSTAVHGISLNTFYSLTAECGGCILVIKDDTGNVFGAFCSEWREPCVPETFYGNGETFLFSVERLEGLPPLPAGEGLPPPHEALHVSRWTGVNNFFMLSHRDHLAVGSGGQFGIFLDAELLHGSSGPCQTFGNVCLCRQPHAAPPADGSTLPPVGEFKCDVLEVWGMDHSMIARRARDKVLKGLRQ